jgi:hypothetical protein
VLRLVATAGVPAIATVGVVGVWLSWYLLMAGWTPARLLPLLVSSALVGSVSLLTATFISSERWTVLAAIVRWLAVLPILYGAVLLAVGSVQLLFLVSEDFPVGTLPILILHVGLPLVLLWPEVLIIRSRLKLRP